VQGIIRTALEQHLNVTLAVLARSVAFRYAVMQLKIAL